MSAEATVEDYYEALRRGEPLYPYFAERPDVVKFGIGERLTGYDEIAEGLREQTRTTDDWRVESRALRVSERGGDGDEGDDGAFAYFSDDVRMSWRDTGTGRDRAFDTRWSGVLERLGGSGGDGGGENDAWLFVGMHVSAPQSTGDADGESTGTGTGAGTDRVA
jgi:hypothetical protein